MPSDGGFQSAEGSSRKRIKTSSGAGRPAGQSSNACAHTPEIISLVTPVKPAPSTNTDNLNVPLHENGHPHKTSCHHEQSLREVHDDLENIRQLITCKMCYHLLYEPYTLTCGHTYCYSCISRWMAENHKNTCPDCRSIIKQQPAPSYMIRELVMIFINKNQLLPDGETSEEHSKRAKEEADVVAQDRANADIQVGGLFKGCFNPGGRRIPLEAIRDHADNVYRCPHCMVEIENGRCTNCQMRVRTAEDDLYWSDDSDDTDFTEDLDADLEDGFDDEGPDIDGYGDYRNLLDYDAELALPGAYEHLMGHGGMVSDPEDDEDDEDDDEDPAMMDFIVSDNTGLNYLSSGDDESESDATEVEVHQQRQRRRAAIILSDDEDGVEQLPRRGRVAASDALSNGTEGPSSVAANHSSDSEDEDEGPIAGSQLSRRHAQSRAQRTGRRVGQHLTIAESDDNDSGDESEITNHAVAGDFSPMQHEDEDEDHSSEHDSQLEAPSDMRAHEDSEDDEDEGDEDDDDDDDDDNDDMSDNDDDQTGWGTRANAPPSNHPSSRRIVMSDHQGHSSILSVYYSPVPNAQAAPQVHAHPFNLDNTLVGIRQGGQSASLARTRATGSEFSSQSSAPGGVNIRISNPDSSGSSRTMIGDGTGSSNSRRRRYVDIASSDNSDN